MKRKMIEHIAGTLMAAQTTKNDEWKAKYRDLLDEIQREHLPSGSGFDNGTQIDRDKSTPERIVLVTMFHHMNEHGMYVGWTNHNVIITPSFVYGMDIRVTGKDRNNIKEYIAETFQHVLNQVYEQTKDNGYRRVDIEVK